MLREKQTFPWSLLEMLKNVKDNLHMRISGIMHKPTHQADKSVRLTSVKDYPIELQIKSNLLSMHFVPLSVLSIFI